MRSLLVSSLILLCACASLTSKKKPAAAPQATGQLKTLQAIAELEDRRSLGDGRLMQTAISDRDPVVRRRAFLALGRIQDPNTAGALVEGLTDPDAAVRAEAAFAVGLLGLSWAPLTDDVKSRLSNGLLARELEENELTVKLALFEAMGRVATAPLLERLTDRLSIAGDVQARASLSLGVAARSKIALPPRAFAALTLLLKKENLVGVRYGAAYALVQTKKDAPREALLACAADDASEIRALCAKGLGDAGSDIDSVTLKKLIDDPDYRVSVEATRSLARLAAKCRSSACPALGALADLSFRIDRLGAGDTAGGGQPLLALAQQGLPPQGKTLLQSLRKQLVPLKAKPDQKIKQDVANLDCRLAAALDRIGGHLNEVMTCGDSLIDEPRRLVLGLNALQDAAKAGTVDGTKLLAEVGSFVFHTDPRVKLAAIELLGELKVSAAQDKVRSALMSPDLVVAAAAASSSAKLGDKSAIPQIRQLAQKAGAIVDIAPTVAEALMVLDAKEATGELESWLKSPNASIRQSAAEALTRLSGKTVTAERAERPVDSNRPKPAAANAKVVVVTGKGEFEIALFTEAAPLTSANMVALTREGFFRNLTFHRVVPDFVAQGGDPRGDGNGGPGYTIRCEINHKPYARGVVGMALSGKDTGGSQFFVTAAPQPHLDGRYTAFGEVVRGQEVVDALLEGDAIIEMRVSQ